MAATGAGDGGLLFRGIYEGSISGTHMEVDRRPYHKNCSCALHQSRGAKCPHHKPTKVSYPIRRCWSEGGSLALYAAAVASSSSVNSSPSTSPAVHEFAKATPNANLHHHHHNHNHQLGVCNEEDDDDLFPCKM